MIRLCGRLRGTHQLNDRFACKQPRLTKIVFNLLERHILRKKSSSLQVRESSLKDELLQQNTSSYEILLLMTLSFLSSPPTPSPPTVNLALQGFWLEREGTELGESRSHSSSRSRPNSIIWALLTFHRTSHCVSHLFSRLCFHGGTGLPFASPFQACVWFSDPPQPKPWAPLEAASLDSVAQTPPWPEPSCCFMLLCKGFLN